jgi:vancomycin permeability regulator SanA
MKKSWKLLRRCLCVFICLGILALLGVAVINGIVIGTAGSRILTPEAAAELEDVDCILVLGCQVKSDGVPSDMLHDRLRRGVELYKMGAAPKLLMSGDHSRVGYNEVGAMKHFAIDAGIPSEDIFMDHAGFSTYESAYRAKDIFQAKKVIIVTQGYHLYRAVYVAQALGLDAYGVASDYRSYTGQIKYDLREALARVKDFGTAILKPAPTHGGEAIPINGNGDLTNDEYF